MANSSIRLKEKYRLKVVRMKAIKINILSTVKSFFLLNLSTSIPTHGVIKISINEVIVASIANSLGCSPSLLIYQGMIYIPMLTATEENKLEAINKARQVFCDNFISITPPSTVNRILSAHYAVTIFDDSLSALTSQLYCH